jgi:hypothetical protein
MSLNFFTSRSSAAFKKQKDRDFISAASLKQGINDTAPWIPRKARTLRRGWPSTRLNSLRSLPFAVSR